MVGSFPSAFAPLLQLLEDRKFEGRQRDAAVVFMYLRDVSGLCPLRG